MKGIIIRLIVFGALAVGVYIFWQSFNADKQRIEHLNRVRSLSAAGDWQKVIDGYQEYWQKYPQDKNLDREQVGTAYINLAMPKYEEALKTKQGYLEAAAAFELARGYITFDQSVLMQLCDCYVEGKDRAKAEAVIQEAEGRPDIGGKAFSIYRKRLAGSK